MHAQDPAYRPGSPPLMLLTCNVASADVLVPFLFRQSHRENRVEGVGTDR